MCSEVRPKSIPAFILTESRTQQLSFGREIAMKRANYLFTVYNQWFFKNPFCRSLSSYEPIKSTG